MGLAGTGTRLITVWKLLIVFYAQRTVSLCLSGYLSCHLAFDFNTSVYGGYYFSSKYPVVLSHGTKVILGTIALINPSTQIIMHAIIPLLYILLIFNKDQLSNDSPYRVCVFSLVGMSYFVFIQYIMYYYWVFPSDSLLQYLPSVVVVGGVLGLCFSPWVKRATPVKAVICGAVFLTGTLSSLIFDVEIKERIAVAGGFYRIGPQQRHFARPAELGSENVEFNRVGYSLERLQQWSHKTTSSGYDFLTVERESKILAEMRPNCFKELGVDTPNYIENSLFSMAAEGQEHKVECIKSKGHRECIIKVKYNKNHDTVERWRWFRYSTKNNVNAELDILFYNNQSELRAEAAFMLKSLQLLPSVSDVYCLTPAEWL